MTREQTYVRREAEPLVPGPQSKAPFESRGEAMGRALAARIRGRCPWRLLGVADRDSPAPRVAIKEDRPASAPAALSAPSPVPSTSFPVSGRLLPPPSIVVQALPRLEQEPEKEAVTAAIDVKRPQLTPAAPSRPRAAVSTPVNAARHVPAEPTADRTLSPATPPPAVLSPTTNVPAGITVTEVAPAPRPAPESPEPETPAAVVNRAVVMTDRAAVRRTLQEYEDAFEDLDVTAAAVVWPSVDRRALSRAFATLKSQGLHFEECDIAVVESNATASCHGTVEFVRRVGRSEPLTSHQRWIFKMRKFGTDWMIEQVTASPLSATGSRVRGAS